MILREDLAEEVGEDEEDSVMPEGEGLETTTETEVKMVNGEGRDVGAEVGCASSGLRKDTARRRTDVGSRIPIVTEKPVY